MTMVVIAITSLRFIVGPFSLQGVLFVAVTAVAAWHMGPRAGLVATALGVIATHTQRFIDQPALLRAPAQLFDRRYAVGYGLYFLLSATAIAVGRRHRRTVQQLDESRAETHRAEAAHREQLEAALGRERAARREAEQANRVREELLVRLSHELRRARDLAAIVESSEDAIVGTDLSSRITSWNRAAETLFGYSSEEMLGHSVLRLLPPDRVPEERHVLDRLQRGENVVHFETLRRRCDGSIVPISLTVSPIRDEHGVLVGVSKIARDVTERKQAEAMVDDLQARLVALVAASSSLLQSPQVEDVIPAILGVAHNVLTADGYAVWRRDAQRNAWHAESISGVATAFAGTSVPGAFGDAVTEPVAIEEVAASPLVAERLDAYEREGIRSVLAVPLLTGEQVTGMVVFYYRTRHVFAESEVQAASAFGNLAATALRTAELYDAQRRSRQASDFLADVGVTLSQTFDRTRTLEQIATLAVPYIADWCAIDLVDESGAIERVAMAHVDPERLPLMREFRRRFPQSPQSANSPAQVIQRRQPVHIEWLSDEQIAATTNQHGYRDAVRSLGVRSVVIVPLITRERAVGALTFARAGSGRRYTAADRQFAEALASRIALALDNARAYEEATRANRLKDEFLATLSHELRTPLNAVVGYVRMINSGVLDGDRLTRALVVLDRNTTALTRLVEDVLDVSRFMAGKVRLDLRPVQVATIVEQAIASTRPAAEAKGVQLESAIAHSIPPVSGDADRLQQITWNLLSNAVKFTSRGGLVSVTVRASSDHVELAVSDSGCGIAPEFLPHVFERFRQGDARFAREHGGLGLGLAITRDLVQLHGGTIQAASDGEGRGATFRVQLPLLADTAPPGQAPPFRSDTVAT